MDPLSVADVIVQRVHDLIDEAKTKHFLELKLADYEDLASLPESVGGLTLLQVLYLDECAKLASLPESVGGLTQLRLLSLYRCRKVVSLPESVALLKGLRR